jgi:hypothetical protein
VDADEDTAGIPTGPRLQRQSIDDLIRREFDPGSTIEPGVNWLYARTLPVYFAAWRSSSPAAAGLPEQQTLERVVSAAIAAADAQRPVLVQRWLDSLTQRTPLLAKQYCWSYLAGWFAETGSYEGFLEHLWNNAEVARHLQSQLRLAGIWALAEMLAR